MQIDSALAELRAELARKAPTVPSLEGVIEYAGRERLAAYYLYTALIAGILSEHQIAPAQWPADFGQAIERARLAGFTPHTIRGLDAELTASEQAMRRSPGREIGFGALAADLLSAEERGARDHWEAVAMQLASAPHGDDPLAESERRRRARRKRAAKLVKEKGISHTISVSTTLAVHVHPAGAAAGIGTSLVRRRIETGRRNADALHRLTQALAALRIEACGEARQIRRTAAD